jgi:hypothetical protein
LTPASPEPTATDSTTAAPAASDPGSAADEQATVDQQIQDFINTDTVSAPAADDALLAEAADSLASANPAAEPTADSVAEPVKEAPVPEPEPEPVAEPKSEPTNDNVTIAHKKVIEPPATDDKPSLNELLAKEEAKESGLPTEMPAASPQPSVTAESEEGFQLPEGASEDSAVPVAEPVAEPPAAVTEPPAPVTATETASGPTVTEPPASEPAAAPAQTPAGPPTETAAETAEPKKPGTDFDPHSVAL